MTNNITQAAANKEAEEGEERLMFESEFDNAKGVAGSQHDVIGWYYFNDEVDAMWKAWQARAKLAADRASRQVANKAEVIGKIMPEKLTVEMWRAWEGISNHLSTKEMDEIYAAMYEVVPPANKEEVEPKPVCTVPPDGWHCTRQPGHEGPCAAVATDDTESFTEAEEAIYQRGIEDGKSIESGMVRLRAGAASPDPVTHLRWWARQINEGHGNIGHEEGYEVCNPDELSDDGSPAFPVYATPPATTGASTAALTKLRARIEEMREASHTISQYPETAQVVFDSVTEALDEIAAEVEPVGASTVLTDDQIKELYVKAFANTAPHERQNAAIRLGRAIEREVAAQAGQVEVPEGWSVRRDDLPAGPRIIVEHKDRASSITQDAEPTLFLYFDALQKSPAKESK